MTDVAHLNGVGLATCLGTTFAEVTAAYASGTRKFVKDRSLVGPDGLPITLAPIIAFAEERDITKRLGRLIKTAIEDLMSQAPEPTEIGLLLLPDWAFDAEVKADLVQQTAECLGCPDSAVAAYRCSQVTAFDLISTTSKALQNGDIQSATLVCVDTMLHADLLDALMIDGRLLSKHQPNGVIPAEASVALRMCQTDNIISLAPTATCQNVWTGKEPEDVYNPKGLLGKILADQFTQSEAFGPVNRLLVDLNGERWRSEEIAHALARAKHLPRDLKADFETPPLTMGHCGCATPAVMAALAMADGPIPAQEALEISQIAYSQFNGLRSTMVLERQTMLSDEDPVL